MEYPLFLSIMTREILVGVTLKVCSIVFISLPPRDSCIFLFTFLCLVTFMYWFPVFYLLCWVAYVIPAEV